MKLSMKKPGGLVAQYVKCWPSTMLAVRRVQRSFQPQSGFHCIWPVSWMVEKDTDTCMPIPHYTFIQYEAVSR